METLNTAGTDQSPVHPGPGLVRQCPCFVYAGDERWASGDIYDDIPRLCLFLPRLQFSRGHNSSLLHPDWGPGPARTSTTQSRPILCGVSTSCSTWLLTRPCQSAMVTITIVWSSWQLPFRHPAPRTSLCCLGNARNISKFTNQDITRYLLLSITGWIYLTRK